jgi:hypothetical protein
VKLNRDGVEMVNAVKRRKESQLQHDTVVNRIKHLQDLERKKAQQIKQIKDKMDRFKQIRIVQSQYLLKRNEILKKSREEKDKKKYEVKLFKQQIESNIRIQREEVQTRNRLLMEEVLRETDLAKIKKKSFPKDSTKSEYKMRIARQKMEANLYNKVYLSSNF